MNLRKKLNRTTKVILLLLTLAPHLVILGLPPIVSASKPPVRDFSNKSFYPTYLYQHHDGGKSCYYPSCISDDKELHLKVEINPPTSIDDAMCEPIIGGIIFPTPDIFGMTGYNLRKGGYRINHGPMMMMRWHDQCEFLYSNIGYLPVGRHQLEVYAYDTPIYDTWQSVVTLGVMGIVNLVTKKKLIISAEIMVLEDCSELDVASCRKEQLLDWTLCNQTEDQHFMKCQNCILREGIWTAVGCIPTDPTKMIQTLMKIGLLVGGGASLLITLTGALILSTSQGDPKKTSESKELITSALIGLVFIIFSVSVLQLIGVQILRIPGFGDQSNQSPANPIPP